MADDNNPEMTPNVRTTLFMDVTISRAALYGRCDRLLHTSLASRRRFVVTLSGDFEDYRPNHAFG
jgi:hypothetical protein